MARTKYKVQAGDNWAKLGNPQQLMAMNPGVPKLSQGQTIWRPSTTSSGSVYVPPGGVPNAPRPPVFGPPKPPGYGGAPFMTAAMLPQAPLPQNLYGPPTTPVPQQGPPNVNHSFNPNVNINYGSSNNPTPAPTTPTTTLPQGYVYQGGMSAEAIEQRRQWNLAAGGDPAIYNDPNNRVFITTRAQVKAMKDANRRRREMKGESIGGGAGVNASAMSGNQGNLGNAVNENVSWRVG